MAYSTKNMEEKEQGYEVCEVVGDNYG